MKLAPQLYTTMTMDSAAEHDNELWSSYLLLLWHLEVLHARLHRKALVPGDTGQSRHPKRVYEVADKAIKARVTKVEEEQLDKDPRVSR